MSLGVRQLWGFWRHASLAPGGSSLIPREPLLLARNPPPSPAATAFFSSRPGRRAGAARSLYAHDRNGEAVAKSATPFESTARKPIDHGSKTAQNLSALFIERISKLPVHAQDTHLPATVNIYPHRRERVRELRKLRHYLYQHRRRTQRIYQRYGENATPRDWRRILQTLLDTTPVYTDSLGTLKVLIPETLVPRLATDPVDNIWEIKSRSGCEIRVHERDPDDPQDQIYFLLSGPWSAIGCAVGDFRRIVRFAQEVRVVPLAEEDAQKLQEHVSPIPWERVSPVRQKYFLHRPLTEIEKPEIWTFDTFERYITALTKSRLPPGRASQLGHGSHTHNVVRAILKAFRDPTALPALSATSFKHALKYIAIHGDAFWNQRKELFDMMTSHGFEITTDVYDIMSLAALKVNDVGFFQAYVHQMAKNGLNPSLTTWIHFLRMIKVEEVRRYILHAMASKRLFDHPSAMHLVSGELIEHDMHRAIQLGFNVKSFIASQNELYGPEWLHWQTSNKVLYALGSYGKFDEINEFLTVMFQSEHARPKDEIALNIILTHCKYHQRLNDAIHFVRRFEQELGVFKASGVTFHLLSTLAWRMRKPHVLSVLWRYSFFELLTPRYLTLHFHQLLLSSKAPRHISRFTRGLRIAGVFPRPPDGKWVGYTPEKRRKSLRLLYLSMENLLLRDYKEEQGISPDHVLTSKQFRDAVLLWYPETFGRRKPVEKLGDLLARAVEEDRRNILNSRAGQAIVLEPLPIRLVRRRVDQTRTPEKERRNMGVQDRSQLDERGLQFGRPQNTLDLGEHYPESGRAETHKVDE